MSVSIQAFYEMEILLSDDPKFQLLLLNKTKLLEIWSDSLYLVANF